MRKNFFARKAFIMVLILCMLFSTSFNAAAMNLLTEAEGNWVTTDIPPSTQQPQMENQFTTRNDNMECIVTLKNHNKDFLGTVTVTEGTALTSEMIREQIAEPVRANYTFRGWATRNAAIDETENLESTHTITEDTILYAVYSRNKINIIFMSGSNEENPGEVIATYRRNTNDRSNTIRLANTIHTQSDWEAYVTKPNTRFLGWKRAAQGNALSKHFVTNTIWTYGNDFYMYAQYEQALPTERVVVLKNHNEDFLGTVTVAEGTALTDEMIREQIAEPVRANYTFRGWATRNAAIDETENLESTHTITEDTILYAVYSRNKINIIFMSGSSEENPGEVIATYRRNTNDRSNTIRLANTIHTQSDWESYVTKPNTRFLGWRWAAQGNALSKHFMTNTIWTYETDFYMYAQYEQLAPTERTITLKNYNEEVLGTMTVAADTVLTDKDIRKQVADPVRSDYVFRGWSTTNGDLTGTEYPATTHRIVDDITLYAVFSKMSIHNVDTALISEAITEAERWGEAVQDLGVPLATIKALPKREASFYEYINEYLEENPLDFTAFQESAAQEESSAAESSVENHGESGTEYTIASVMHQSYLAEKSATSSLSADRMAHAIKLAQWSTSIHPDLDEKKEVIYMYMSHYVDVTVPFDPSYGVSEYSEKGSLAKYITDYDRDTYDLYFMKAAGLDLYNKMAQGVTLAVSGRNTIRDALNWKNSSKLENLSTVFGGGLDGNKVIETYIEDSIGEDLMGIICTSGQSKGDVYKAIEQLEKKVISDYNVTFEEGKYARDFKLFYISLVLNVALGSYSYLTLLPLVDIYTNLTIGFANKANFLSMTNTRNVRVIYRMYYSIGDSNGRWGTM